MNSTQTKILYICTLVSLLAPQVQGEPGKNEMMTKAVSEMLAKAQAPYEKMAAEYVFEYPMQVMPEEERAGQSQAIEKCRAKMYSFIEKTLAEDKELNLALTIRDKVKIFKSRGQELKRQTIQNYYGPSIEQWMEQIVDYFEVYEVNLSAKIGDCAATCPKMNIKFDGVERTGLPKCTAAPTATIVGQPKVELVNKSLPVVVSDGPWTSVNGL